MANLSQVQLQGLYQAIFEMARKTCTGSPAFRQRKLAEAQDLLALAQISDRLTIHWLDLSADLRAKVEMRVPVPCLPNLDGPLQIAPAAVLGITYAAKAMIVPQPGFSFVRILAPRPVWLGAVSPDANQVLCLGNLPAGTLLKEIVLMTYGALTGSTTQLDVRDPVGVLNPAAVEWWQRNTDRLPLTKDAFLDWQANPEANHAG